MLKDGKSARSRFSVSYEGTDTVLYTVTNKKKKTTCRLCKPPQLRPNLCVAVFSFVREYRHFDRRARDGG